MKTEILKLNGIFNMSFGKTFFTGETQNINTFINGKSKWDIFIDDIYFDTIEFENENLPLSKDEIKTPENKIRTYFFQYCKACFLSSFNLKHNCG